MITRADRAADGGAEALAPGPRASSPTPVCATPRRSPCRRSTAPAWPTCGPRWTTCWPECRRPRRDGAAAAVGRPLVHHHRRRHGGHRHADGRHPRPWATGCSCSATDRTRAGRGPRPAEPRRAAASARARSTRVALNLRGVPADEVRRGDALLTPDAWPSTRVVDVRRTTGEPFTEAPEQLIVHVGTAAVPARLRAFDDDHARLTLDRRAAAGARRSPGAARSRQPPRPRRGAGARRRPARAAPARRRRPPGRRAGRDARRRSTCSPRWPGAARCRASTLRRLGLLGAAGVPPTEVRVMDGWWVHAARPTRPGSSGCSAAVASCANEIRWPPACPAARPPTCWRCPIRSLLDAVVRDAGLEQRGGQIRLPGARADLGPAEAAVAELEARLTAAPVPRPGGRRSGRAAPWRPRTRRGRAGRPAAAAARRRRAAADRTGAGDARAGPARAAVHHQPGPPGPEHHPAGGDPAARTPRRPRLDPPARRRPPRGRAPRPDLGASPITCSFFRSK